MDQLIYPQGLIHIPNIHILHIGTTSSQVCNCGPTGMTLHCLLIMSANLHDFHGIWCHLKRHNLLVTCPFWTNKVPLQSYEHQLHNGAITGAPNHRIKSYFWARATRELRLCCDRAPCGNENHTRMMLAAAWTS